MWINFGVIWPYRLQDHSVLVLKKDAEIFLATQLEVKFVFKITQMKKLSTIKVVQNHHINTLVPKKTHEKI